MLLYNLLVKHTLDIYQKSPQEMVWQEIAYFCKIVFDNIFQHFDCRDEQSILSFRNILETGVHYFDKEIREFWDSPTFFKVLKTIFKNKNLKSQRKEKTRDVMNRNLGQDQQNLIKKVDNILNNFKIITPSNGLISEYKVRTFFEAPGDSKFLLMPIMLQLGRKSCESRYKSFLFQLIGLKYFSGMLGGKDNNAFYIFGSSHRASDKERNNQTSDGLKASKLLYLDPHVNQEVSKSRYR